MLQIINLMERMGPQHKSSCCSRRLLVHILRNKYSKKNFLIIDFMECMGHWAPSKSGCFRGLLAHILRNRETKFLKL